MLYIDPESCVDCGACLPECPSGAIFYEDDVPPAERDFIALNAEMSLTCPQIVQKLAPLARTDLLP